MSYYNGLDKITYQQLIMEQIKRIQDICAKELRDTEKIFKNNIGEQVIEGEDTRYSFLQSVELLGSMLSPYFGKLMTVDGKNLFEEFCEYYDAELIEIIDDINFQKKVKEIFRIDDVKKIRSDPSLQAQINVFLLNDKIKEARKIFRKLIEVFKAHDFLGGDSFNEGSANIDDGGIAYGDNLEGDIIEDNEEEGEDA